VEDAPRCVYTAIATELRRIAPMDPADFLEFRDVAVSRQDCSAHPGGLPGGHLAQWREATLVLIRA
jgi:hypothetical protein